MDTTPIEPPPPSTAWGSIPPDAEVGEPWNGRRLGPERKHRRDGSRMAHGEVFRRAAAGIPQRAWDGSQP